MNNQVKTPNPKHQITNKSQIPIFNDQNKNQVWSAGGGLVPPSADYLFVICDLEFLFLQYAITPALLYKPLVIPESAGGGYPESSDLKPFWTPASAGVTLSC